MEEQDKTTITLEPDQSAIVLGDDGMRLFIPNGDPEEEVADSVLFMMAMAALLKEEDEVFLSTIRAKIEEMYEMMDDLEKADLAILN